MNISEYALSLSEGLICIDLIKDVYVKILTVDHKQIHVEDVLTKKRDVRRLRDLGSVDRAYKNVFLKETSMPNLYRLLYRDDSGHHHVGGLISLAVRLSHCIIHPDVTVEGSFFLHAVIARENSYLQNESMHRLELYDVSLAGFSCIHVYCEKESLMIKKCTLQDFGQIKGRLSRGYIDKHLRGMEMIQEGVIQS